LINMIERLRSKFIEPKKKIQKFFLIHR